MESEIIEVEIKEILKEKNVVKKAYLFGIYVGLSGHIEWSGWVKEILEEIYREAESKGVYEEVKEAYKEGKELGKRERARRIQLGLMKESEKAKEEEKERITQLGEIKKMSFPIRERMPRFLEGFLGIKLPRFLRGGL
ncbi:hypothetical protein [Pyrococcus abyssi]|nr:hypothetical protein [Pyrococcus abyssi]CCE70364.1 TPA: hypothetical protein PAB0643 [Pyrococcus abyssi GE5]